MPDTQGLKDKRFRLPGSRSSVQGWLTPGISGRKQVAGQSSQFTVLGVGWEEQGVAREDVGNVQYRVKRISLRRNFPVKGKTWQPSWRCSSFPHTASLRQS